MSEMNGFVSRLRKFCLCNRHPSGVEKGLCLNFGKQQSLP
jgi:hypothetical protein